MIAAAWVGSDDLRAALSPAPCGCELIKLAARRAPNDPRRKQDDDDGREMQKRWGCPAAGFDPPAALDDDCRDCLEATARVTGCADFATGRTCPLQATDSPYVRRVLELHHWREKGAASVVAPHLADAAALAALNALDGALNARLAHEATQRREQMDAQRREAELAAKPKPSPSY